MRHILRLALLCFLLITTTAAQLTVDAQILPRLEVRDGYKILFDSGQAPALFVCQRSRLNLTYSADEIKTRFSLQDVRVWGDESNVSSTAVTGDPASIDLFEAWIEYRNAAGFAMRVGRQALNIDDQRLISQRNWNQNGLSYDALRLRYLPGDWQIDLFFSLNNSRENTAGNQYPADRLKTLNFLYLKGPISERLSNSLILLASGVTANDTSEVIYMRGTLGDYWHYTTGKLDLRGAIYYQFGKNGAGQTVAAYLGSFDGMVQLQSLKAGAGIVYLSGHDALNNDSDYQSTDHLFDLLYGARHGYYGFMDFFTNMPVNTAGGGLLDACLKLQYGKGKTGVQLNAHRFYLANNVLLGSDTEPLDDYLGTEFDFTFKWKLHPAVTLQSGYAVMFPGASLERIRGISPGASERPQWFWLMLDFNSTLFQGI